MSSVGLSGMSGISENTLQNRYEKALKQINKLIQMNRQFKQALAHNQDQIRELQSEKDQLERNNRQLDEENNILEQKYMELDQHYRQLQQYCGELQHKFQQNQVTNSHVEEQLRSTEEKYRQELQNEIIKGNQLAHQTQILNQMYQESLTTLQNQCEKSKQVELELAQMVAKSAILNSEKQQLASFVRENNVQNLQKKLDEANKTIQNLMRQCNQLKNKQIDNQVMEQKKRFQKQIGYNTLKDNHQNNTVKDLIDEYKRRLKKMQIEKKDLQKKYKHFRSLSNKMVSQQSYQKKIQSLERLTEKQQLEMGNLIQTYDHQLHHIAHQNQKLKENYNSITVQLSQKIIDLSTRQNQLLQLKDSVEKATFENQSLKKMNNDLVKTNQSRLRQLTSLHQGISQAESLTIIEKKQSADQKYTNPNIRNIQVNKKEGTSTPPLFYGKPMESKTSFDPTSTPKPFPITVNYRNPSDPNNDFNFIQSVNIINGYNVNLSDSKTPPKK